MDENDLSYLIRGAAFSVYNILGPGLLEHIYESALKFELESLHLDIRSQEKIPVRYKENDMGIGYRADLIVNQKVIIEIKSIKELDNIHYKQLLTYLKLSGHKLGLLINFNTNDLATSIVRIVNKL